MGKVRPELSKKNPLYINKRTFYHTYYFALGYPEWKEKYCEAIGSAQKAVDYNGMPHGNGTGDPTAKIAIRTFVLKSRIDAVEQTAMTAGGPVYKHLLYGVTHEGITYKYLSNERCKLGKIPCGRNQYYQMRRLFYYLLSKRLENSHMVS